MLTLGVDTSNYATSLAVVDLARQEVICAKKRFLPVKEGGLGLRQSEALFQHTLALPEMFQELEQEGALAGIQRVGVSEKPRPQEGSYMPCFLAGVSAATAVAAALGVPLVKTTHQQGHIASALFGSKAQLASNQKALFFHVSGGTTELLLIEGYTVLEKLGGSLDLYAGQAVDRLGVSLGFGFPAGAALSELAERCTEKATPKVCVKGMDCHLSGLQNQYEGLLQQGKSREFVAFYCLAAAADTVTKMAKNAMVLFPDMPVFFAGGVMSSSIIQNRIKKKLAGELYFVPPVYSSDNAIGAAVIAAED